LGKIIGGGFPVGAFGGRKEIMDLLAPAGPVYQAGTLSGNPIAMAAGIAVMDEIQKDGFYKKLNFLASGFISELNETATRKGLVVNSVGAMFSIFFKKIPVKNYNDLKSCDHEAFARFYRRMLQKNIYLSPAQGEANFISAAHTSVILGTVLKAINGLERI